jgi:hypothetical protein
MSLAGRGSDFTLEDLVNMNLDGYEEEQPVEKPKKRKKKKVVKEDTESSEEDSHKYRKNKKPPQWISSKTREVFIIFVLFVFLSSKLACGQADKLMRIQSADYSIYDLLVRGIAMTLLFFIFCRLFN